MDNLIVGALHKRRIDIAEYAHALGRHAGAEGHTMLFTNADVESPVGHFLHHELQRTATGHRRGDTENVFILLRQLDDGMPEYILVFRRLRCVVVFLVDLTGDLIKKPGCVPFGLVTFGQGVSLSFGGDDMQQLRTRNIFQVVECIDQFIQVMSVDGSEIAEFQCLKQIAALAHKALDAMLDLAGDFPAEMTTHGQFSQRLPDIILEFIVGLEVVMSVRYSFSAPTFGSMLMQLSFRIMSRSVSATPA